MTKSTASHYCASSTTHITFSTLWKKSTPFMVSVAFHVSLLAIFLSYKNQSIVQVDQAGRAGNAFTVLVMNASSISNVTPDTEAPAPLDPIIKTVDVENAEIVVPKKKDTAKKQIKKKASGERSVARTETENKRSKPGQANTPARRDTGQSASHSGPAAELSKNIQSGSGGNAVRSGESTAGQAAKGAGNTTSTKFHILNRRVTYPTRARSMGIEGQVKVQYDVSPSGTIKNIRILAENPPTVFSSELRRDMLRWRYDTNGELKDQIVTVIFKIDGRIQLMN